MTRSSSLPAWLVQVLYLLTRPLLLVHFAVYSRTVRRGIFPEGSAVASLDGTGSTHVLFVGDIAVSGFGVLHHGMAVPAQAASAFGAESGRGVAWNAVGTPSLRAAKAASLLPRLDRIDVAVVMLGIPDVLLVTRNAEWARGLEEIATRIRATSGPGARVIFAGIPPMQDFQPIAAAGRAVISGQVARLNEVTARAAAEIGAEYVPFPEWRVGEMFNEQVFSFRAMHRMWAQALVPAMVRAAGAVPASV